MKLLGQDIPVQENLFFSFKHYFVWWLILIVTVIFDFFTTLHFVEMRGVQAEANLVVKWLMMTYGVVPGVFLGKILQLLSVLVFVSLHKRLGNLFLLVVILINCWAVVMNSIYKSW